MGRPRDQGRAAGRPSARGAPRRRPSCRRWSATTSGRCSTTRRRRRTTGRGRASVSSATRRTRRRRTRGAGAGMGIEDCYVLGNLIGEAKSVADLDRAFRAYDEVRRPRTQKLVTTSREAGRLWDFELEGPRRRRGRAPAEHGQPHALDLERRSAGGAGEGEGHLSTARLNGAEERVNQVGGCRP